MTSFRALTRRARRGLRPLLLFGVPLLVAAIAGVIYLLGGRYVDTENAYVQAPMTRIAADVDGRVVQVAVDENQAVAKGDLLLRIDPEPYRLALARAGAELREARNDIETLKARYRTQQAEVEVAKTDAQFAGEELKREQKLAERQLTAPAELDSYRHKRNLAVQKVAAVSADLERIRASLGGDPDIAVRDHPRYQDAAAARDQGALDLRRTAVRAPFAGIVANVPDPGTYAATGKPLLSIVGRADAWVEANFKETQLTHMSPGQAVEVSVDAYPDRTWHGRVESISQATGAEFSVLPPQNATGNWVKVVQRVPVRIALDTHTAGPALRSGLSATVSVDTGQHARGPSFLMPAVAWLRQHALPESANADAAQ